MGGGLVFPWDPRVGGIAIGSWVGGIQPTPVFLAATPLTSFPAKSNIWEERPGFKSVLQVQACQAWGGTVKARFTDSYSLHSLLLVCK